MSERFDEGELELGPQLILRWDNGRRHRLDAALLRARCPCETCKLSPIALEPAMFPNLSVVGWAMVGRYALQLEFSDGHRQGAYSLEMLESFPEEV